MKYALSYRIVDVLIRMYSLFSSEHENLNIRFVDVQIVRPSSTYINLHTTAYTSIMQAIYQNNVLHNEKNSTWYVSQCLQ